MLCASLPGCRSRNYLPKTSTKTYLQFVALFYQGLAGLQVGDDVRAEASLSAARLLAPGEPAVWVDWGVLALRQRNYDAAFERLNRAHSLAPESDQVDYLLGLLESDRGNSTAAIPHLREAVRANPRNLRAAYQLASELEREGGAGDNQQFQQLMQQILEQDPGNLAALLELSRISAKRGDSQTLRAAVSRIATRQSNWPAEALQQFNLLQTAAAAADVRGAATRSIFMRNVLMRVPQFRNDLSDLKPQPGEGAQPMLQFLKVQNPPSRPSPADRDMRFLPVSQGMGAPGLWSWAGALPLNGEAAPVPATANGRVVHLSNSATLSFPGGSAAQPPNHDGVLAIDFNYDFKNDLVLAGAGGVRMYRQDAPSSFTDVSAASKLPPAILNGSYNGAWALDVEADGDLDILLGAASGVPVVLRNNGDGTFAVAHPFVGLSGVRQFVWVDLNGDGNPDAAMIDGAKKLHVFLNQRSGNFMESKLPPLPPVQAITAADVGATGQLNLVAADVDGDLVRIVAANDSGTWAALTVAHFQGTATSAASEVRLYAEDVDNNGAVDLVLAPVGPGAADPSIWLQTEAGNFVAMHAPAAGISIFALADLDQDGRLALVGLSRDGALTVAANRGTKPYQWQTIRPRAKQSTGDQRINPFGIGGEIELRAGLLLQKQPITSPELHFGLGAQKQADVARILWPNGSVRAEFNLKPDQQVVTEQRLKGSCPFLFAWNGHAMAFVKDSVPWGSAIGLRINALGTADIAATEEWYKIGADQLQPRDGFYDLRVTGELWETYYYDSMALMTVDHPAGTQVFTDERYDVPAVKLAITTMGMLHSLAAAVDDHGQDVSAILKTVDGQYLDTFGRGQYQGITRDHFVEIDLPQAAKVDEPLWLVARGWLHPSDSSVNVAISQGNAEKPRWLSLEIPDGHGGWRVAQQNLGFPAGRNKICLIDLEHVFPPGIEHRLRLRTNLEVYWDSIEWAQGEPATPIQVQRLTPSAATLRYRGFSTIRQTNMSSPELPVYEQIAGTSQRWRDLEGYYTRFGDVRELLNAVDDRYVIMNAGDEMALSFAAPPPPPTGWVRDFVIAGDGWIKDGDYNSSYSQSVLPYPHHARRDYHSPPSSLESDWVYVHHAKDWEDYQTRYVTHEAFDHALQGGVAR